LLKTKITVSSLKLSAFLKPTSSQHNLKPSGGRSSENWLRWQQTLCTSKRAEHSLNPSETLALLCTVSFEVEKCMQSGISRFFFRPVQRMQRFPGSSTDFGLFSSWKM